MDALSGLNKQYNRSHPDVAINDQGQVSNKRVNAKEINCQFNDVDCVDADPWNNFVWKSKNDTFNEFCTIVQVNDENECDNEVFRDVLYK